MVTSSDHAALLLQLTKSDRGTTPFKFLNSWLRDDGFNAEFRRVWAMNVEGSPMYVLHRKIKAVRIMGKYWAQLLRQRNESSRRIAAELHSEASRLQTDPSNQTLQISCRNLKVKLIEYQHRELLDLQQRAHINWLT